MNAKGSSHDMIPAGESTISSSCPRTWLLTGAVATALALAVAIVYWPVRTYSFITLDDPLYVMANPVVQQGITAENLRWAFTASAAANWHPLTWLSHMLDCSIFGHEAAGAQHLVNVGLHALNAILVFLLLRAMTGATWRSAVVAALFAVHPLRVESVAWIAERKDVLSACLGLLALMAYARYARRPRVWTYALVVALMALSLLAKPMLVTLPCVMLLLDVWPLARVDLQASSGQVARRLARLVLEKAPLFLLSGASCFMTVLAQRGEAMATLQQVSFAVRLPNAVKSIGTYIGQTLWPVDLCVLYPLHPPPTWQWTAALGLVLAISLFAFWQLRARPFFAVGWLWFLGTLVPVLGIVQVGVQAMADRYTYWPSIGLLIMLTWGTADLLPRAHWLRAVAAAVATLIIVMLVVASRTQVGVWSKSEVLYRHALKVTNRNWSMHNALGTALVERGDRRSAIVEFEKSVDIEPAWFQSWANLADAHAYVGSYDAAIRAYRNTLTLKPLQPKPMNNLAALMVIHTDANVRNGPAAVGLAYQASELTHWRDPTTLDTLAAAYGECGRFDEAVMMAERAEQVAREVGQVALAQTIAGKIPQYRAGRPSRALTIDPGNPAGR